MYHWQCQLFYRESVKFHCGPVWRALYDDIITGQNENSELTCQDNECSAERLMILQCQSNCHFIIRWTSRLSLIWTSQYRNWITLRMLISRLNLVYSDDKYFSLKNMVTHWLLMVLKHMPQLSPANMRRLLTSLRNYYNWKKEKTS